MKKVLVFVLILLLWGCVLTGCGSEPTLPEETKPETKTETEAVRPYQFTTDQLAQYVIVYEGANPDFAGLASELADHLVNQYGVFLTTAKDTASQPAPFEILLGDTNRTEGVSKVMEYSVTVRKVSLSCIPVAPILPVKPWTICAIRFLTDKL